MNLKLRRLCFLLYAILFFGCEKGGGILNQKEAKYISKISMNNHFHFIINGNAFGKAEEKEPRYISLNEKNQITKINSFEVEHLTYNSNNKVEDYSKKYSFSGYYWEDSSRFWPGKVSFAYTNKYNYRSDGKLIAIIASPLEYHSYYTEVINDNGDVKTINYDIDKFSGEYDMLRYYYNPLNTNQLDSVSYIDFIATDKVGSIQKTLVRYLEYDEYGNSTKVQLLKFVQETNHIFRLISENEILLKFDRNPHYARNLYNHLGWLPIEKSPIWFMDVSMQFAPVNNVVELINKEITYEGNNKTIKPTITHHISYTYDKDGLPITATGTITGSSVLESKIDMKFEYKN